MPAKVKQMLDSANAEVPKITPEEARRLMASGKALVVDVRDGTEVAASGKVKGAINVPRGMLEFRADPESSYYDSNFTPDKEVILYCGAGGRAALSAKTLKDMGYEKVHNLGAFKDWQESGGEVEK